MNVTSTLSESLVAERWCLNSPWDQPLAWSCSIFGLKQENGLELLREIRLRPNVAVIATSNPSERSKAMSSPQTCEALVVLYERSRAYQIGRMLSVVRALGRESMSPSVAGTGPNDTNDSYTFQDASGADRLDSLASGTSKKIRCSGGSCADNCELRNVLIRVSAKPHEC
jgi:hypothetical protein